MPAADAGAGAGPSTPGSTRVRADARHAADRAHLESDPTRPTHHGLAEPPARVAARLAARPRSGASSSSSGAPACHALQPPPATRVRSSTPPGPRQWIADEREAAASCSRRERPLAVQRELDRTWSVASPAGAAGGNATARATASEDEASAHRGDQRDAARVLRQARRPSADRILTPRAGAAPLLQSDRRGRAPRASARFLVAAARRALVALPAAPRTTPRVLVVESRQRHQPGHAGLRRGRDRPRARTRSSPRS